MALRSSRELSETSGREMDWKQLQDDSIMREAIVGDTEASATDQRLERSLSDLNHLSDTSRFT